MKISYCNPILQKPNLSFKARPPVQRFSTQRDIFCNPKKERISNDLYFIQMKEYDKDEDWAKKMTFFTYKLSDMVSRNVSFDKILKSTCNEVNEINDKVIGAGVKKIRSSGEFLIGDDNERGSEYYKKYSNQLKINKFLFKLNSDGEYKVKSNSEYPQANTVKISKPCSDGPFKDLINIKYAYSPKNKVQNLDLAKKEYNKLKSIENPTLDEINRSVATIHWLIAQETPFIRGSDSIANLITKSIYHSYGVHLSPIKSGKSFDFEAFNTNLDKYIKKYPDLFSEKLYFINN